MTKKNPLKNSQEEKEEEEDSGIYGKKKNLQLLFNSIFVDAAEIRIITHFFPYNMDV